MVPLTLFCFVCLFLGTYIYTCTYIQTHTHTHTHVLKCICDGFVEWDISINKDVTAISDLGPQNGNEGPQKGKQSLWSSRCHPHSTPSNCWGALRKFRECEKSKTHRMLALDSRDAYERNDFNNPRLLYLPIHRRALNSLTWDVYFSLINGNLMFTLLAPLCYKLLYILLSLLFIFSFIFLLFCPVLPSFFTIFLILIVYKSLLTVV